jgi:hypothetical protein
MTVYRNPPTTAAAGATRAHREIHHGRDSSRVQEPEAPSETCHVVKPQEETKSVRIIPTRSVRTSVGCQLCVKAPCLTSPPLKANSHSFASTPPRTFPARSPNASSHMNPKAAASAPCFTTQRNAAPTTRAYSDMTKQDKPSKLPRPSDGATD